MRKMFPYIITLGVLFAATVLFGYLTVSTFRGMVKASEHKPATENIEPPPWFKGSLLSQKPYQGEVYSEESVSFAEAQGWGNEAFMYYSAKCGENPPFRLTEIVRYIIRQNPEKPGVFQYSSEEFPCAFGQNDKMSMYEIDMFSSQPGFETNVFCVVSKLSETHVQTRTLVIIVCGFVCILCSVATYIFTGIIVEDFKYEREKRKRLASC